MEQLEKKRSTGTKEPDFLLKLEEPPFAGFAVDDGLLDIIENKKKYVKMELVKETNAAVETDKPSVSSPNTNHVNKKNQSKSSMSSPETCDIQHNRNPNKRFKKENAQTESIECLEANVRPSLELSTPTFNLTSTPRNRRSIGRKMNVDISDPIFKLPFEHGWKRELVFRNSGEFKATNRANRSGDVYYYSPNNRKLRSLREIQEQLELTDNNILTIESFSFLKQAIGINDLSKELIREANTKLSKEDSFAGINVRPKKSKTPTNYELSSDENNKSSNKMKILFKNDKKRSRSGSKKDNKSDIEAMNEPTSSTPEYTAEDWQAVQSNVTPKASSSKTNDINNKTRNYEMNGSLREISTTMPYMQSLSYMIQNMTCVFKHLKIQELLSASRVCKAWNLIAKDELLWQTVRLKNSMVYDWESCMDTIDRRGSVTLDTRRMLIPSKMDEFETFWLKFAKALKRANKLKVIELYRCPTHVVEDAIYSLPQLSVLNAISMKNPHITKEGKNNNDLMTLGLKYLGQMTNLTEIRLKGLSGMKLTSLPTFENLVNLKTLSLTSIKSFPKDIYHSLETVSTSLEFLEIGDNECLTEDFAVSLKRFVNLSSLRLENCCGKWENIAQEVFGAIRSLENLRILELVNIEFTNCVEEELEKCDGIRALLIIPAYVSQSATTNCHMIDCLKKLSNTLTHLVWGLTHELLRVTDLFITQYQQNQHAIGYNLELSNTKETSNNIPILRTRKPKFGDEHVNEKDKDKSDNVDILSVPALQKLLETMMLNARTKVVKVPFSGTTRVYLTEHFSDI